ncbi:MAG: amino acid adenylation domain-containing protein, partial [Acidobacteriota bacterium]|nr:amino acid adenylation domain-containing protein [Acidobacteriota bacterium]
MSDFDKKLGELSPGKRALFELLRKQRETVNASVQPAEPAGERMARHGEEETAPLSFPQQRLWYLDRLQSGASTYNVALAFRLEGKLNEGALSQSLTALAKQHEQLRLRIDSNGNRPLQTCAAADTPLPVLVAEANPEAIRMAGAEGREPFDLAAGPLFRAKLIRISANEHILTLTLHHIICDGWSIEILLRDLARLYADYSQGREPLLEPAPITYRDYARWQREPARAEAWEPQLVFWKRQLADAPAALKLLTDLPRPENQTFRGAKTFHRLDAELARQLRALCDARGVTLFTLLLAAYQVLLFRYSGQHDFIVGSPVAGRGRIETEALVGFFVNMLPLRCHIDGESSFEEFLKRTQESVLDGLGHIDVPVERIIEELQVERNPSYSPLFQTGFGFSKTETGNLKLPGLRCGRVEIDTASAKFDLTLEILEEAGGLFCALEYNTSLFEPATCARYVRSYEHLLRSIAAAPWANIGSLSIATPGERELLTGAWSGTATPYPADCTVHELFAEVAARTPDAIAIEWDGGSFTYGDVVRESNRIAGLLHGHGVGPGDRVATCFERSAQSICALLGVLKTGAAYVPLDPAYPAERLEFMLADARPRCVLTSKSGGHFSPASVPLLLIDGNESAALPKLEAHRGQAGDLAYIMYTSGSTGKPKGVCVPHRGIVRLVRNTDFMQLDEKEVLLQFAPVSFDAATLEIWGALLNGGRLVLFEGQPASVQDLGNAIARRRVTSVFLTTALFNLMVDNNLQGLGSLRQLLFGGDTASMPHVLAALQGLPHCRLIHAYGPTENTTFTTCATLRTEDARTWTSVPIGSPIANTRAYILDGNLQPVPAGASGELHAGGDGVARGYWERPELTREKFLPDPFAGRNGSLMYKTGDLARWRSDGQIEFLGRLDEQVKIRGFRIEPGEVAATLLTHESVASAQVVMREDRPGEKRLVAYIVKRESKDLQADDLRGYLKSRLPEYMVPPAYVFLNAIPLTPNGKVDRKALPSPQDENNDERGELLSPVNDLERKIAAIWQD